MNKRNYLELKWEIKTQTDVLKYIDIDLNKIFFRYYMMIKIIDNLI